MLDVQIVLSYSSKLDKSFAVITMKKIYRKTQNKFHAEISFIQNPISLHFLHPLTSSVHISFLVDDIKHTINWK